MKKEGYNHKQLPTHHDRSRSVTVSAVLNNANTIQYIIHFTWTHTHTHAEGENMIKNSTRKPTASSSHVLRHVALNRGYAHRHPYTEIGHMLQSIRITSLCMGTSETKRDASHLLNWSFTGKLTSLLISDKSSVIKYTDTFNIRTALSGNGAFKDINKPRGRSRENAPNCGSFGSLEMSQTREERG